MSSSKRVSYCQHPLSRSSALLLHPPSQRPCFSVEWAGGCQLTPVNQPHEASVMKRAGGINGAPAHQGRQPRCEKPFMVKQHEATEHRNHCLLFLPLVPRLSFKSPHQAPTAERNTVTGAVLEINVFPPLFTYD